MAALTFCSNFYSDFYSDSSFDHQFPYFSPECSPELFYVPPPQLVPDPVFDYIPATVDDSIFFPTADPSLDDASSFIFSDACPYFSPQVADELVPVSTELFPFDEFEFHCPKRQRVLLEQSFCCGGSSSVGGGGGYFPPTSELFLGSWDGRMDNAEMMNNGGCLKIKPSPSPPPQPSNNLSAQTIAARERRRKITAKTQELGELIPGGSKMNTAEMLNSAFKYVKFLQAQVAILQLKQETEQEQEHEEETENLRILESSVIQEKLYSEEKCLVSKGFVQNLANFPEIQSQPSIFNSIYHILQSSS